MALEFVARNGIIAQNNSTITGSLTVTNGITGSISGIATSASFAISASQAASAVSSSFASNATSASFAALAATASYFLTSSVSSASFATSASYAATSSFASNFTVTNTLTAQTLVVQTVSSSVVYSSGSNVFGNDLSNTQVMTGSVSITGSFRSTGPMTVSGSAIVTGSLTALSLIKVGGTSTQYLMADGSTSLFPDLSSSIRSEQTYTATANQTIFTVTGGYVVGLVDVYVNGVKYAPADYTATNGTTVVLTEGVMAGDIVDIINYKATIAALPTSRDTFDYTATAGQTSFTVSGGYVVGLLDVYVNGVKLTSSEYTATNGTTFVLAVASVLGDQVQAIRYNASVNGVSGAGTTNFIPKFTASQTLGNSLIQDNGTTITLGGVVSGSSANFSSTVTASAFIPTGSTVPTNGMYLPAANTLAFATSGSVDMTLTSAGNVLINKVNDEGFRLDVSGTGRFSGALSGSSATFTGALVGTSATFSGNGSFGGAAANVNPLYVKTATDSNLRVVDAAGTLQIAVVNDAVNAHRPFMLGNGWLNFTNVGAATFSSSVTAGGLVTISSDSGGSALRLIGRAAADASAIRFFANNNTTQNARIESNSSILEINSISALPITFATSDTERMRITSGGNIGIGTTSPFGKLSVNVEAAAPASSGNMINGFTVHNTNGGRAINLGVNEAGAYTYIQAAYVNNADVANNLAFFTGATERMRITSGGNIGIGTSDLGPDGLSLLNTFNYSWSEGSGNAYAVLFRQRNSAATVVASGYKRSSTGSFASSFGISMARAAIAVGYNNGSIAFFSDTATNVANGTDIAPSERMTIINNGNVLIGTTTDYSAKLAVLLTSNNSISTVPAVMRIMNNGINFIPKILITDNNTADATICLAGGSGAKRLSFGVQGISSGFEYLNILENGNIGIGTTAPGARLTINANTSSSSDVTYLALTNQDGENVGHIDFNNIFGNLARITGTKEGGGGLANEGIIAFSTATNTVLSEKMRIISGGNVLIGQTSLDAAAGGALFQLTQGNSNWIHQIRNSNTSGGVFGSNIVLSYTPNNAGSAFLAGNDSSAERFRMYSNGGLANYQANNVNLSDIRTKKDIIPLESYWNKFKALEIVKFKYKDQTHDDYNIGVIAQQVESVAPEFVDVDGWGETPEDGVPLKTIYTADLYHATIKVLQEAMDKIETLTARVQELENK